MLVSDEHSGRTDRLKAEIWKHSIWSNKIPTFFHILWFADIVDSDGVGDKISKRLGVSGISYSANKTADDGRECQDVWSCKKRHALDPRLFISYLSTSDTSRSARSVLVVSVFSTELRRHCGLTR